MSNKNKDEKPQNINIKGLETAMTGLRTRRRRPSKNKKQGPIRGASVSHDRRPSQSKKRRPAKRPETVVELEKTKNHQDFLVVFHKGMVAVLDAATKKGIRESPLYKLPYERIVGDAFDTNMDEAHFHVLRRFKKSKKWATSPQPWPLKPGAPENTKVSIKEFRSTPPAVYIFRGVARAAEVCGLTETINLRHAQYKALPLGVFHFLYRLEYQMVMEYAHRLGTITGEPVTRASELTPASEPAPSYCIRVQLAEYTDDGQYIQAWDEEWDITAQSRETAEAIAMQRVEDRDPDWVPLKEGSDYERVLGVVLRDQPATS